MADYLLTSSRPRPITATVTKPKWMEPTVSPSKRRSLDSTGSTASLCSVLDHDSYTEYSDDEASGLKHDFDKMELEEGPLDLLTASKLNYPTDVQYTTDVQYHTANGKYTSNVQYTTDVLYRSPDRFPSDVTQDTESRYTSRGKSTSDNQYTTDDQESSYSQFEQSKSLRTPENKKDEDLDDEFKGLSPWERWLLNKTREERIKKRFELMKKQKEDQEKAEEKTKKSEQLKKGKVELEKWRRKKEEAMRIQAMKQKEKEEFEKAKVENEEAAKQEKCSRKFSEWQKKKREEERRKKKEEKERQRLEAEKERERKEKAEANFKQWVEKVKKRPSSAGVSRQRSSSCSKLADHPELASYPEPSYVNPIPWQPIKIPREKSASNTKLSKTKNKKSRSQYAWNPEKYF